MKILGHTTEGNLIIEVSRAEWDSLKDGVRPSIPDNESARAILEEERAECKRLRLSGNANRKLSQSINAVHSWFLKNPDMPFDEFLRKLENFYFVQQIEGFGPHSTKLLLEHFSKGQSE